jgi:hypothetical protein
MKIRSVGAELFHANARADKHDEGNVASPTFANASKMNIPISTHLRSQPGSYAVSHTTYYAF